MDKQRLRRYAVGALAVGAVAGGAAIALPATTTAATGWRPVTYGLHETPAQLLPATISAAAPVRIVSTALDSTGRPVVTVGTATDRTTAAALVKDGQTSENAVSVETDATVRILGVPSGTDPYRAQQWDFSLVRVAGAWGKSTGAGVTVAVVDSGVDASHPDLAGQVLPGYDFVTGTAGTSSDPNGHGTHVAGTIAALTGNAAGVSSIAPDAKILPIRVIGSNGSGKMSDTAKGIIYAADHGAGVINMSLGSTTGIAAVTNAIAYARSKGVVVVAAAGNAREDGSPVSYPGADNGVIAVSATDSADRIASYSNQGSYVDVAAPGTSILSTVPAAKAANGYLFYSGTSMATPHVAALAALIKAENPALSPDQVESAIERSAVDLGTAGKDNDFGYGRIDALAAVTTAAPAAATPTVSASPSASISASPSASASASPSASTSASPSASASVSPSASAPASPSASASVSPSASASASPSASASVSPSVGSSASPSASPTAGPTVAPKVTPVIQTAATATRVVYGTTSKVTWTVTADGKPLAGQPVQVGTTTAGGTTFSYTKATTDAAGRVAFSRAVTGRTQVKLVVPATSTSLTVTSSVTTVAVRAAAKLTTPAKRTLNVTLTGATGQKVQVQRYENGRWVPTSSYPATVAKKITGLRSGAVYRVVVPDTAAVTGVTSGSIKVP